MAVETPNLGVFDPEDAQIGRLYESHMSHCSLCPQGMGVTNINRIAKRFGIFHKNMNKESKRRDG